MITDNGYRLVKSISFEDAPYDTQLYNLVLDGDHTYHADGYLVHNKVDAQIAPDTDSVAGNKENRKIQIRFNTY